MSPDHFIITGTSKGIGEQLAQLLLDEGHYVHGIARNESNLLAHHERYHHFTYDLGHTSGLETLMESILTPMDLSQSKMVCLINNAGMVEPLKRIESCDSQQIELNVQIGLIAPMILSSSFIRYTSRFSLRKKIINISSGSGSHPAPGMSSYCSSKAGLNMFTQCVGLEQSAAPYPVEMIAVSPGMVETDMQRTARAQDVQEFEMAAAFQQAHDTGYLLSTEEIGSHLMGMIKAEYRSGEVMDYNQG
ncbi:(S)-benzoin forming benzil reductase [Paenibacillus sp. JCM 10914]|uniref:SDR family NAD(P)-dependent oxidoreductase n=1 Tax=Paenibacillus sp. JCM 10914 TaxID=1236974 RepID=UPI0003CC8D99|nr:SDR family NAD(P)-dependent oxidoreductase [Paenibacillus sp. JCM 10914]GAE06846.1 short chain dehydrogenase [Paenibacillus sp. JCM 10914]